MPIQLVHGAQTGSLNPKVDHKPIPLWKLLLLIHDHDQSFQPTYEECIELLEYDAELLADGAELDELKPDIKYHLALCSPHWKKLKNWSEKFVDLMEDQISHA